MAILNNNPLIGASGQSKGYRIERSLRFNSADSAYLNRTPASAGSRTTWTVSFWIKRSNLGVTAPIIGGSDAATGTTAIRFETDNTINFYTFDSSYTSRINTTQVFRDVSAWYHIVGVFDTTSATSTLTGSATDRVRLYVNGVQVSAFSATVVPSQNYLGFINSNVPQSFNARYNGSYVDINGTFYLTEVNFIDGQALTPSSFGETDADTGVWKPKAYSGSYGTNGFYLKFADNSGTTSTTLGKDSSGNSNNWTPNNFSVTAGAGNDSLVDSPTQYGTDTGAGGEVRGNYCTLNPVAVSGMGLPTISNGNLDVSSTTTNVYTGAVATIGMAAGKWYWEYTATSRGSGGVSGTGIVNVASLASSNGSWGFGAPSDGWLRGTTVVFNSSATSISGLSTINDGDIINVAVDFDNGKLWFGKNGTWESSGNPASGTNETVSFTVGGKTFYAVANGYSSNGTAWSGVMNFGQRPFAYTAPSGFKALCTTNLPTPTIGATATTRANKYFDASIYTGTGSTLAVTNGGFQPDLVWTKRRDAAYSHYTYDSARGTNKLLFINDTQGDYTASGYLNSFDSGGYTLGTGDAGSNANGGTYVGWQWKANGAGSSNTQGTITSTVSANTTAGFSIVTATTPSSYTSYTVGHGLGATPAMLIYKERTGTSNWQVWHKNLSAASNAIQLNTTGAEQSGAYFGTQTSTVAAFQSGVQTSLSAPFVVYCFAPVAGYSAFGSYVGNGVGFSGYDGPFVYTGFRPRYVLIKVASGSTDMGAGKWCIYDAVRNPYNATNLLLYANLSSAESNGSPYVDIDILSNGFKIRGGNFGEINGNGNTYIYAAFAENPFKYSLAR